MKRLAVSFWNNFALKSKHDPASGDRFFGAEYLNKTCFRGINRGMQIVRNSYSLQETRVLKSDLWNESMATERNVLSHFTGLPLIYGIDVSNVVCEKAHSNLSSLNVAQGDIRNLPFQSDSLHLILDISTLDHVCDVEAAHTIREYSRVLSTGGVLVLLYAQSMAFAKRYWKSLEGVFLLNNLLITDSLKQHFCIVEDRGADFLRLALDIPPFQWLQRFVWHCPEKIRKLFVSGVLYLEYSHLSIALRGYCGLRLVIAVKGVTK